MFKYLFFNNNNYLMSKMNNDILKYLTNPIYQRNNNNIEELTINNEDKDFYRKRILSMSKNIYSGVHYDDNLNKAYNDFVFLAINYCKLTDKKDLLQEEYDIIAKQENNIVIPNDNSFNLTESNHMVFRSKKENPNTLDTFIHIKNNTQKDKFIPQQKKINLKQEKLKKKGIKDKKHKKDKKDKIL